MHCSLFYCHRFGDDLLSLSLNTGFSLGSESMPVSWCTEFLSTIMQVTQHSWSASTFDAMPAFMSEWYRAHQVGDAYRDIRTRVDEDYKKLTSNASQLLLVGFSMYRWFPSRFGFLSQRTRNRQTLQSTN